MSYDDLVKSINLLILACESVENQSNWDKRPYSIWYYDARKLVTNIQRLKKLWKNITKGNKNHEQLPFNLYTRNCCDIPDWGNHNGSSMVVIVGRMKMWINYKGEMQPGFRCPRCKCAPAGLFWCWGCKKLMIFEWLTLRPYGNEDDRIF